MVSLGDEGRQLLLIHFDLQCFSCFSQHVKCSNGVALKHRNPCTILFLLFLHIPRSFSDDYLKSD